MKRGPTSLCRTTRRASPPPVRHRRRALRVPRDPSVPSFSRSCPYHFLVLPPNPPSPSSAAREPPKEPLFNRANLVLERAVKAVVTVLACAVLSMR